MATDFIYPSNVRMKEIEQEKLPRLTANRPIFDFFPLNPVDSDSMLYEQIDNIKGLQQARGLGGDPRRVKAPGSGIRYVEPGVYGEFRILDEVELTRRRQFGMMTGPVNVDDLVMRAQDYLLQRQLDRQEKNGWDLLAYGVYTALGEVGQILHRDIYAIQTVTFGTWATHTTSTPLADLRYAQLLSEGKSANFGSAATAWMNRRTFNHLAANVNQNDLGGKRTLGLASVTGVNDINRILTNEDLPSIRIYHEGYYDDAGNFQLFIPDNKVILAGVRNTGVGLGEYQMTRNVNNPAMAPGSYSKIIDRGETTVPRSIEVHQGHNGGPVLFYASSMVSITV